jgi:hypothetical protein
VRKGFRRDSLPEYCVWKDMNRRCRQTTLACSKNYSMRGIAVCEEWLRDFWRFYGDMGPCPKGFTIEREDNNKGYSKENCLWATRSDNQNNRRNTVMLEYKGTTKPMAVLCKEMNIGLEVVRNRLKLGWKIDCALETPKMDMNAPRSNARLLEGIRLKKIAMTK